MACDTDIVPDNGYIETTQSDASTFVMQGYEDSKKGFNVFNPEGSSLPFYLKEKTFMVPISISWRMEAHGLMVWQKHLSREHGAIWLR